MLNIFNKKIKNNLSKDITLYKTGNETGKTRHFPPANKEWFNSIYAYNKSTSKLLPIADKVIAKLIKSYFNLYSRKLENKIKSRSLRLRFRRLSTNRILVSRAELKHTSDKVIITVYVYNRQKKYYLRKIKKVTKMARLDKNRFMTKIRLIKIQALKIISRVTKEKNLLKSFKWQNNNLKNYEKQYSKNFIVKSLRKEMLFFYLKQIMSFNKSKFDNTYLLPLKNLIEKVYKKKVEFNFVNLKYLHLNSSIFSETIVTKLRNRKNRLLRVLKASLRMVKLSSLNKLAVLDELSNRKMKLKNFKVSSLLSDPTYSIKEKQNKDALDHILQILFPNRIKNKLSKSAVNTVLNSIKHKSINGIRIEASGRLSRRFTAARSVFKLKYIGGLKNMDSSYKGFSSVILRGHAKSNVQHTKVMSKTRIGSFGIKGWISSN